VQAAPAVVFAAFFEQPQRWLCRSSQIDARVGGALRLCWPDGCCEGSFVQYDPETNARFTWQMQGDTLPPTMVVVRTDPGERAGSTALEVEHYGFGVGADWDMAYMGAARAWAAYLKNLRAVLEANVDLREPNE
jgi:uncharacterized protein YndB with AHSA1/START domain